MEAAPGFEPGNEGFAVPCLTTWLCRLLRLERETGFEPATPALARQCSTPELFPLLVDGFIYFSFFRVKSELSSFLNLIAKAGGYKDGGIQEEWEG